MHFNVVRIKIVLWNFCIPCVYKDYIFIQCINPYIGDPLSVPLRVYSVPAEPPSPASCSVESPGVFCCPSFPNDTGCFRCPQERRSGSGHSPQHICCGGNMAAAAPLSNPTRPQRFCLKTQAMLASPAANVGWGETGDGSGQQSSFPLPCNRLFQAAVSP